jgi:hypothetical protein
MQFSDRFRGLGAYFRIFCLIVPLLAMAANMHSQEAFGTAAAAYPLEEENSDLIYLTNSNTFFQLIALTKSAVHTVT